MRPALIRLFALDLRALALYRVGLGTLVLVDLWGRGRNFALLYGEQGVLPRAHAIDLLGETVDFSLHLATASPTALGLIFLLHGAFALMLLLGWRTRLATFATWALLWSLHARNPMVVHGGEGLLLLALFFGGFLPLGGLWSVDAAKAERPASPKVSDGATAALLAQVAAMYFFSALHKLSGPEWSQVGTAAWMALHIDLLARPLGVWMRQHESLLRLSTFTVLWWEVLGPLLLFVPHRRVRQFAVLGFAAMHLAFHLCLDLGIFAYVDLVVLLALWPWSEDWRDRDARLSQRLRGLARLPGGRWRSRGWLLRWAPLPLIPYLAWWNVGEVFPRFELPLPLANPGYVLGLQQGWEMFAPNPNPTDGWWVFAGTADGGQAVDVFPVLNGRRPTALTWEKPPLVLDTFAHTRINDVMTWLLDMEESQERPTQKPWFQIGEHLCATWGAAYPRGPALLGFDVVFVSEDTPMLDEPDKGFVVRRRPFWRQDCVGKGSRALESTP